MKKLFTLFVLVAALSSCTDNPCKGSASCVAPPEGEFQNDQYNIAITPSILIEGTDGSLKEELRLDSVIVQASSDIFIDSFYSWISLEDPQSVRSFTLYGAGETIVVDTELPEINSELKGYLVTFIKNNDTVSLSGKQASEDMINGVCNDVISC